MRGCSCSTSVMNINTQKMISEMLLPIRGFDQKLPFGKSDSLHSSPFLSLQLRWGTNVNVENPSAVHLGICLSAQLKPVKREMWWGPTVRQHMRNLVLMMSSGWTFHISACKNWGFTSLQRKKPMMPSGYIKNRRFKIDTKIQAKLEVQLQGMPRHYNWFNDPSDTPSNRGMVHATWILSVCNSCGACFAIRIFNQWGLALLSVVYHSVRSEAPCCVELQSPVNSTFNHSSCHWCPKGLERKVSCRTLWPAHRAGLSTLNSKDSVGTKLVLLDLGMV